MMQYYCPFSKKVYSAELWWSTRESLVWNILILIWIFGSHEFFRSWKWAKISLIQVWYKSEIENDDGVIDVSSSNLLFKDIIGKKFFNKIFDLFQRFWICANEKVILEIIFESSLIKFSIFLILLNTHWLFYCKPV